MDFKRNGNLEDTPFIGKIKVPEEKIKKFLAMEGNGAHNCIDFAELFEDEIGKTADAIGKWVNSQDNGQVQTVALVSLICAMSVIEEQRFEDCKIAAAMVIAGAANAKRASYRNFINSSPFGKLFDALKNGNRGGGC